MIAALALAGLAAAAPTVEYDPGEHDLAGRDRPYTSAETDGFIGGGLTAARFAGLGVAVTVVDPARGAFPYAALHVDEAVRTLAQASVNRPLRWDRYESREERARRSRKGAQDPNSSRR